MPRGGHQSPIIIKLDSIAKHHLLDSSSISEPNFFSVSSAINSDIMVIVEKIVRVLHLWYIHHINILDMNDIIRSEPLPEYHLLDFSNISMPNYPSSICIKADLISRDIFAEYHLLDYICINGPKYISVIRVINLDINIKAERFIRTICPLHISLFINQDMVIKTGVFINIYKVEPCSPYHNDDISHIGCDFNISYFSIYIVTKKKKFISIVFMPYINLLYNNLDINVEAEGFIRNHHYAQSVESINREVPSEDHRLALKSHHGAASMNTSEKHIIYVQHIMAKREDIQTSHILTILCVFISKYFILSESIIDNHFHIILVELHQWESGTRRFHLIEWKETNHRRIIFKNIDFNHHYIYMKKKNIVIHDIAANLSSRSITQDISIIDTIIYDIITHHIGIYDSFGTIIVDDIDLTSMIKEYILLMFIDFMKHPSVHIDLVSSEDTIVLDNVIIEKKDIFSWTDTVINLNIKSIISILNLNNLQQLSNILQKDSVILHYISMTNIYDIYNLLILYLDISNHNLTMVGIMDYHIDQIITDLVISIQLPELSQLNIYYRIEFNIEHIINHLETYSTYHIKVYFIIDMTLVITYLNQFIMELYIMELYNTINETSIIRNVNSDETSYMDIVISEFYITISDTDIFV